MKRGEVCVVGELNSKTIDKKSDFKMNRTIVILDIFIYKKKVFNN